MKLFELIDLMKKEAHKEGIEIPACDHAAWSKLFARMSEHEKRFYDNDCLGKNVSAEFERLSEIEA